MFLIVDLTQSSIDRRRADDDTVCTAALVDVKEAVGGSRDGNGKTVTRLRLRLVFLVGGSSGDSRMQHK